MNATPFISPAWIRATWPRRVLPIAGLICVCTLVLALNPRFVMGGAPASSNTTRFAYQFAGADAGAQITACIAALPVTGGICDFRALTGNQTASATIVVNKPVQLLLGTMTLTGTGSPVINLTAPGAELICSGRDNTIIRGAANVNGVALHNKSLISHCTLRGTRAPGSNGRGIDSGGAAGASDVVVEDNIIEQWTVQGINIADNSTGWIVRSNTIRDNLDEGILLGNKSSDIIVEGNIIYGNGRNGIDVTGRRNVLRGNILHHNGGVGSHSSDQYGILLYSTARSGPVTDNIVTDNVVNDNNTHGIVLAATTGGTVARNLVSGNIVVGNGMTGTGNWGDGIHLEVGGGTNGNLQNNSIVHNIVEGSNRHGINLEAQASVTGTVAQNLISDNQVIGNGQRGIFVPYAAPQGTQILHNIVLENVTAQISNAGTRTTVAGNKTLIESEVYELPAIK